MRCAYLLLLGLLLPLVNGASNTADCPKGLRTIRKKCVDEDECRYEDPICGNNAVCYNTYGSYYCQCETGYHEPSGSFNFTLDNSEGCEDFNECLELNNICGLNALCNNTDGSYFCTCRDGFVPRIGGEIFNAGQGVTCDDINECLELNNICGLNALCHNTDGSYFCTCRDGFVPRIGGEIFNAGQGVTCDGKIRLSNTDYRCDHSLFT